MAVCVILFLSRQQTLDQYSLDKAYDDVEQSCPAPSRLPTLAYFTKPPLVGKIVALEPLYSLTNPPPPDDPSEGNPY